MTSVQRRVNSTDRVRIPRARVRVRLEEDADPAGHPKAFAVVDLGDLKLPLDAQVALEAYFRSSSMRFPCGTVSTLHVPEPMLLSDIDRGGTVRFRLLVVDASGSGRLLGSAEGISPAAAKPSDGPEQHPLLPLRESGGLGEELWRVQVDPRAGPILEINNSIPGLAAEMRQSPLVQGLVLPHALRVILQELGAPADEDADGSWGDDWRRFLRELELPIEPEDNEPDSLQMWIDSAVETFCRRNNLATRARGDGAKIRLGQ